MNVVQQLQSIVLTQYIPMQSSLKCANKVPTGHLQSIEQQSSEIKLTIGSCARLVNQSAVDRVG